MPAPTRRRRRTVGSHEFRTGEARSAPDRTALSDISDRSDFAVRNRDHDEDELARLVEEVREARERLARLITAVKAERAGWDEREQRWAKLALAAAKAAA